MDDSDIVSRLVKSFEVVKDFSYSDQKAFMKNFIVSLLIILVTAAYVFALLEILGFIAICFSHKKLSYKHLDGYECVEEEKGLLDSMDDDDDDDNNSNNNIKSQPLEVHTFHGKNEKKRKKKKEVKQNTDQNKNVNVSGVDEFY